MNELSIGYGEIVSSRFADLGISPHIRAIVDNVETMRVTVQTGAGIAITPGELSEPEDRSAQIVRRPVRRFGKVMIAAYHSRHTLSRRKRTLINWLLKSPTPRSRRNKKRVAAVRPPLVGQCPNHLLSSYSRKPSRLRSAN